MKQISFALYRSLHYLGDAPRSIKSDGVFLQERELGKEEDLRLLRRGILGERLEDTQQTMKNMIAQCKNAAEILFLFKNYIALLEEKIGTDHPNTKAAVDEMGLFIKTIPLNERICVYDVVKSTVGVNGIYSIAYNRIVDELTFEVSNPNRKNSNKEHYAMAMRTLGIIRRNQRKFESAKSHFEESFSCSIELEVEKPMVKLQSMNDLAVLYSEMEKYGEAFDLFTECLEQWKEVLRRDKTDKKLRKFISK